MTNCGIIHNILTVLMFGKHEWFHEITEVNLWVRSTCENLRYLIDKVDPKHPILYFPLNRERISFLQGFNFNLRWPFSAVQNSQGEERCAVLSGCGQRIFIYSCRSLLQWQKSYGRPQKVIFSMENRSHNCTWGFVYTLRKRRRFQMGSSEIQFAFHTEQWQGSRIIFALV